jgi:hypothetical protein
LQSIASIEYIQVMIISNSTRVKVGKGNFNFVGCGGSLSPNHNDFELCC